MAILRVAATKGTVTLKYRNQWNDNQPDTYLPELLGEGRKVFYIASKLAVLRASKLANAKQPRGTPCRTLGCPQTSPRGDQ